MEYPILNFWYDNYKVMGKKPFEDEECARSSAGAAEEEPHFKKQISKTWQLATQYTYAAINVALAKFT